MHSCGHPVYRIGSKEISTQVVDGPFGSDLKVDEYVPDGVPLIRVSNCRTGRIQVDDELVYITEEKHRQIIRSEVLPGDVLLTKAGAILGYSAVFPPELTKGNITSHLASIRPTKNVEPRFLSEFLMSKIGIQQIYRWGNKSTRPELNTDEVRAIEVVLPPIAKQKSLVAAMDAARAVCTAKMRKANLLLTGMNEFVSSLLSLSGGVHRNLCGFAVTFKELQGVIDPKRHLQAKSHEALIVSDVCNIVEEKVNTTSYGDSVIDWIRIDDIGKRPWDIEEVRTQLADEVSGMFFEVQKDDILVARLGPTILNQKIVIVRNTQRITIASAEFLVLRCKPGYDPEAVMWVLRTDYFKNLMYSYTRGSTPSRYRLNRNDMLALPFPQLTDEIQSEITKEAQSCRASALSKRSEAEAEWKAAKTHFEEEMLR